MPRITRANDAYGHELWAYLTEGRAYEIAERDDGFIAASEWPKRYFEDFNAWAGHEMRAMRFVQDQPDNYSANGKQGCDGQKRVKMETPLGNSR